MTTARITASMTVVLIGLTIVVTFVCAGMPPYVCPGTPCPECRYEGIGESKLATTVGQSCDPVNNPCNGTLMCCFKDDKLLFRCSVPVATAPRNGSCPPRPAVKPRRQCPQDSGLSCNYDDECKEPGHKCCMAYECCISNLCLQHKCVPAR